ncbi:MAG: flagellar hook-associated protein FlgK [Alphaproteobacteria bacterium]
MGIASLDTALTGLRVSQQQVSIISNNIANVGTPGYTRKILPQSAQAINGVTVGVAAETIIRNVDLNLERDLWTQVSAVGGLNIQKAYLDRIQQFHGPPDQELSIAAEIARLRDSFSALSDSPEDTFLQSAVLNQASDTANKINDLSGLITTLRNDAQEEMQATVTRINDLLIQIADLNDQISDNGSIRRTTAFYEDARDSAIEELSGLIDISFFQRGDGVLVIQTNRGVELASNVPQSLTFNPLPISAVNYYPDSVNGIFVGDPTTHTAVNLTTLQPGGKLGGLLELRDDIFLKQMAQLDELAHKMALRMEAQGLRLFTDASGTVPLDTAPDPTTLPPTPVPYVGFSAVIQVNEDIFDNLSLLKNGTYGATLDTGSNEVIRRILEFGFGTVEYQQAENTNPATQVDLLNRGGLDLQEWLGVTSSNTMTGGRDLSAFADVAALVASANGALDDPNDIFHITFEEPRTGLGPTTITVDLSLANGFPGATAADQLAAHINSEIAGAGVPAGLAALASVGANGELVISTRGSYEIDANAGPTSIGNAGLVFLGLSDSGGVPVQPTDPYFDVQIGNNDPVRITLEPGDTDVDLIAKLQAVPGLAVDTVNFALDGILRIRPGTDFDNPDFGGDLKLTGGPFETNTAAYGAPPALTARTAIDDGANIIAALFGTYSVSGTVIINETPVISVNYGSETNASLPAPIPTLSFRETNLGPGADISTRLTGSRTIIDYAQKIVNEHSQQAIVTESRITDETALRDVLQKQLLDESGVNLDEELGQLIVVQTAYNASARVLTAVDELFEELLNAVR